MLLNTYQKCLCFFIFVQSVFTSDVNSLELLFKDYNDYSSIQVNNVSSCKDVLIKLNPNESHLHGIIHSPNYKQQTDIVNQSTKCRWVLVVPQGFDIKITLVDIEEKSNSSKLLGSNCPSEKLSFTSDLEKIKLSFFNLEKNVEETITTSSQTIDTCDKESSLFLRPFANLKTTTTKQLTIDYETSVSNLLNFLLSFQLVNNLNSDVPNSVYTSIDPHCNDIDEFKCVNTMKISNNTLKQYSCIRKDLICNCLTLYPLKTNSNMNLVNLYSDKCQYLLSMSSNYVFLQQTTDQMCNYFLELNSKCKKLRRSGSGEPEIQLEDGDEYIDYPSAKDEKPEEDEALNLNTCSHVYRRDDFGWIASPNYYTKNRKYDFDLNCSYQIQVQPYQTIQIRFKNFYLNPNLIDLASYNFDDALVINSSLESSKKKKREISSLKIEKTSSLTQQESLLSKSISNLNLYDFDYLTIYDGPSTNSPILARFSQSHNDFNKNFNSRVINSNTNRVLIVFHTQSSKYQQMIKTNKQVKQIDEAPNQFMGFNFTYQIKGFCIEDQLSCNSLQELNCYSKNQTCNDVWDCHNGADEKGCGMCKPDQFRCRNHIFCYRLEDRCDGDHQCIDKSDELNCDRWFCNSDNGTFLCNNGRCVYEQWVCDGTNDCDDGSDETDCPTSFTSRRVITTAVLGGTLCCLLLVMALGCACKLYSLHTVGYRNTMRLTQSVQSSSLASSLTTPLINTNLPSNTQDSSNTDTSTPSTVPSSFFGHLHNFIRHPLISFRNGTNRTNLVNNPENASSNLNQTNNSVMSSTLLNQTSNSSQFSNGTISANTPHSGTSQNPLINLFNTAPSSMGTVNELPHPHHTIAPPTYNQTMGLVDEYEQRQLAFIEHVRSILSQQQQLNGAQNTGLVNLSNPLASITIIPTVGSSSTTTVHRVTSGGGSGRRSHSSRHHRHHHHLRSSSIHMQDILTNPNLPQTNNNTNDVSTSNSGTSGSHRHRSNRHRHNHLSSSHSRHHHGSHSTTANACNPTQSVNNTLQDFFDANRRGLIQFQAASSSSSTLTPSQDSSSNSASASDSSNQRPTLNFTATSSKPTTSSSSIPAVASSLTSTPSSTSVNLRDRIAKLIKDIVVNHGDNIQYVQLESSNNNNNISNNNNNNSSSSQLSSSESILSDIVSSNNPNEQMDEHLHLPSQPTSSDRLNSSSSNINSNHLRNEDDEPLIQA